MKKLLLVLMMTSMSLVSCSTDDSDIAKYNQVSQIEASHIKLVITRPPLNGGIPKVLSSYTDTNGNQIQDNTNTAVVDLNNVDWTKDVTIYAYVTNDGSITGTVECRYDLYKDDVLLTTSLFYSFHYWHNPS